MKPYARFFFHFIALRHGQVKASSASLTTIKVSSSRQDGISQSSSRVAFGRFSRTQHGIYDAALPLKVRDLRLASDILLMIRTFIKSPGQKS
jgi:hypothetical protein